MNPTTITTAAPSGILQGHVETANGVVHKEHIIVGGSLEIEKPDSATYSI